MIRVGRPGSLVRSPSILSRPGSTDCLAALAGLVVGVFAGCAPRSMVADGTSEAPALSAVHARTHASVELLTPPAAIPGSTIDVGVRFTIEPGWHLYWNGQNDSGSPMEIEPILPTGLTAGRALWPAPERMVEPGGVLNHVYEREVILIVPVKIAEDAKLGPAELRLDARWLVCKDVCLPESGSASAQVSIEAPGGDPTRLGPVQAVANTRTSLPIELAPSDPRVRVTLHGSRATIECPGAAEVVFMPGPECSSVKQLLERGLSPGDHLTFEVESDKKIIRISGIVRVTNPEGVRAYYHIDTHAGGSPAND